MKVTLDLDRLLQDGDITPDEHDRLKRLASRSTGSLAFNILIGFGVIAVSGSALALVPSAATALVLGLAILAGGMALMRSALSQWQVLANLCVLVGALMLGGAITVITGITMASVLVVTVLFAITAVIAQSALLAVLSVLSLAATTGMQTGYAHARYGLGVPEPTVTIVLFSLLACGLFFLAGKLPAAHQRLPVAAARTALFLINFGFWVGSLFGDRFYRTGLFHGFNEPSLMISAPIFAVLWAIGLLATALWAWRHNRRWVLNVTAVFAGIHLYTQWFEHLSLSPGTVLAAGLVALACALGLRTLNSKMKAAD